MQVVEQAEPKTTVEKDPIRRPRKPPFEWARGLALRVLIAFAMLICSAIDDTSRSNPHRPRLPLRRASSIS